MVVSRSDLAAADLTAVILAALILAVPSIWNGFPFLYWDSFDYIKMPFDGIVPVFRSGSYTIVTSIGMIFGTLWSIIAAQTLLLAYLLHEAVATFVPRHACVIFLALVLAVSLLTSLPWYASQIMPDAFTGLLVLGLAALAFATNGWSPRRRAALVAGLGIAVAVHSTHIALSLGLLLVFGAMWGVSQTRRFGWLEVRLAAPAAVIVVALVLAVSANWALTGRTFLMQPIGTLTFARMVQDGSAKHYLDKVCPEQPTLRMCKIRDRLPPTANLFLWMPGPFYEVGGWSPEVEAEAKEIVLDSLWRFPIEHAVNALKLTWQQFWAVRAGEGLINLDTIHPGDSVERNPFMPRALAMTYPAELPAYQKSRQRGSIDLTILNAIQVPIAFAGVVSIAVLTVLGFHYRDRVMASVGLTVLLALLGNAFICGALSNPADRYQGRIVWIALAVSILFAFNWTAYRAKRNVGRLNRT
jgi:hypothetical protein